MADLPQTRLHADDAPFSNTGVDCFGPFQVKRGRLTVKRYGCIFTCMTMRAIHLEILHSLDSDSFINALRRFIARRGQPRTIISDNGGNFVSANKELLASAEETKKISDEMLKRQIEWRFNPPHASHMGGAWERQIRSVRKVLLAITDEQTLNDETLNTLMCEVEMILNNRPITPVSDDINDLRVLRPADILLFNSKTDMAPTVTSGVDRYKRRWRQVQYLANLFWTRWKRQYVPELQKRQKWIHAKPNVCVGDVVLISDENLPRNLWPLARVTEVFPSSDGLVRSVRVKTRGTHLVRPIHKLVMLEGKLY